MTNFIQYDSQIVRGDEESVLCHARSSPSAAAVWDSPRLPCKFIKRAEAVVAIREFQAVACQVSGREEHNKDSSRYTWTLHGLNSIDTPNPIVESLRYLGDVFERTQNIEAKRYSVFIGRRFTVGWHLEAMAGHRESCAFLCLYGPGTELLPDDFVNPQYAPRLTNPVDLEELAKHSLGFGSSDMAKVKESATYIREHNQLCVSKKAIIQVSAGSLAVISPYTAHRSPAWCKQPHSRVLIAVDAKSLVYS